jgi:hypothetical protein
MDPCQKTRDAIHAIHKDLCPNLNQSLPLELKATQAQEAARMLATLAAAWWLSPEDLAKLPETPQTDSHILDYLSKDTLPLVAANFARQLEAQLLAAQTENTYLKTQLQTLQSKPN